jgi:hypothetical protein
MWARCAPCCHCPPARRACMHWISTQSADLVSALRLLCCTCSRGLSPLLLTPVGGSGHLSAGTARESIQSRYLCCNVAKGVRWHSSGPCTTHNTSPVRFIENADLAPAVSDQETHRDVAVFCGLAFDRKTWMRSTI